jgi:hypothetical protein
MTAVPDQAESSADLSALEVWMRARRSVMWERIGIVSATTIFIVFLFGLLGYFWLPGFAKSKIEHLLSQALNRPVSVQSIEIKPYTLELMVRNFRIGENTQIADHKNILFSFDQLYVDLSIESIARLAPVISVVSLTGPRFRLVREDDQHFNISDLIKKYRGMPETEAEVTDESEVLFSISNITIEDGYFEFDDRLLGGLQQFADINLGIPFIANFESVQDSWVEPHFSALINGAPVVLQGKLRPFPDKREASLLLKLNNINLTHIEEYVPFPSGTHLLSGFLDSDVALLFTQAKGAAPSITLSGRSVLKQLIVENLAVETPYDIKLSQLDLRLDEIHLAAQPLSKVGINMTNFVLSPKGEAQPALSLSELNIDKILIDRSRQHIGLEAVSLTELKTFVRRLQNGALDWLSFFESVPYAASDRQARQFVAKSVSIPLSVPIPGIKPEYVVVIPLPGIKPEYETELFAEKREDLESTLDGVAPDLRIEALPLPGYKPDPTERLQTYGEVETTGGEVSNKWDIEIGRLKLVESALRFEDHTLPEVVPMVIEKLDLTLDHIDLNGAKPVDLVFHATVNQRGHVEAKGTFAWDPLAADLTFDFKDVDLVSMQGWVDEHHNALLTKGDFSFQGNAKAGGDPLKIILEGKGQLANFNVLDKFFSTELLRWKKIDISTIRFDSEANRTDIGTIGLSNFFARIRLTPEGTLDLGNIIPKDKKVAETKKTKTPADEKLSAGDTLPVRIDRITLRNGNINFTDQFIQPNYRTNLTGLKGQIGPVHPGKLTIIEILGAVDRSAPLEIKGKADFFGNGLFLDLTSTAKGIDMPSFTPYSGKYIGYAIEKGKLSVDINYHVEEGQLRAQNHIFLDQLTLGGKIDSPEAVSLPLNLAISLLKNRRNEINIRLPLSGSINDPQFSLGGVIWQAFVNLLTRAVTAPFTLLASLFGSDEELSELNFPPGYSKLETDSEQRLRLLADILNDRPGLKLEITGLADPVYDHDTLKRVLLERKIKSRKLTEAAKKGRASGTLDQIELNEEEYARYLEMVYKDEKFEKPTNIIGLTKSLPVPEMEELILANTMINDEDFRELAENRANVVYSWLVEQGGISNERVFMLGTKIEAADDSEHPNFRVQFSIR